MSSAECKSRTKRCSIIANWGGMEGALRPIYTPVCRHCIVCRHLRTLADVCGLPKSEVCRFPQTLSILFVIGAIRNDQPSPTVHSGLSRLSKNKHQFLNQKDVGRRLLLKSADVMSASRQTSADVRRRLQTHPGDRRSADVCRPKLTNVKRHPPMLADWSIDGP